MIRFIRRSMPGGRNATHPGGSKLGMGSFSGICMVIFLVSGCAGDELSDAYGQFEAEEITVSSEVAGRLLAFRINEGDRIEAGLHVGITDTTQVHLQKEELAAQLEASEARIRGIEAEVEVVREELSLAQSDLNRITSLTEDGAATRKQLDDARGRVNTLQKRITALQMQTLIVRAEMQSIGARRAQLEDQLKRAMIINPVRGVVLQAYVEPHELVGTGSPLYQIANLDTLDLRVYVSGAQLPSVVLGQPVEVQVDQNATENRRLEGTVSWISTEAEFTPRMIQTKEERVTQVYAVKIRVPNPDGILRIGMPGEVNFWATD